MRSPATSGSWPARRLPAALAAALALAILAGNDAASASPLSPTFSNIDAGLPAVAEGGAAWGDYDNDGDLDLLLAGAYGTSALARVFRNDGAGVFVDIQAGLMNVGFGCAAWGDYDNDGDLDIALTGFVYPDGYQRSFIYRNDGGGVFTRRVPLPGLMQGSVAWGDYDNDGDLDLFMCGNASYTYFSRLCRNDGGDVFTTVPAGFYQLIYSACAWGDYDGDGDLDLAMAGDTPGAVFSRSLIYRNDGGAAFTDVEAGLPGAESATLDWGDYDGDGDLDLLLTGHTDVAGDVSRIYRNDAGDFVDIGAGLIGITRGAAGWGDYDNDGDLDILLSGATSATASGLLSCIYRNDGGDVFVEIDVGLRAGYAGMAEWGDYDNDGDLDIFLAGRRGYVRTAEIYRSDGVPANLLPTAPGGLAAGMAGNRLTLSWSAAVDAETPAAALSYNLRVGTTPGGSQILSAMADPATGFRRVAQLGNAQERLSWAVELPPTWKAVYWSVQAVDGAYAGSPFAPEDCFAPVPALASLVDVDARSGRVRLTWYVAGDWTATAIVYRRGTDTGWAALGLVSADGTGYLRYEDGEVEPGSSYGYRLGIPDGGGETFTDETWVEVPREPVVFALAGIWPNPSRPGELTVRCALPSGEPARLEVLDVRGRRVVEERLTGSGPHTVALGRSKQLPAGVYVVRLTQGANSQATRAVVVP